MNWSLRTYELHSHTFYQKAFDDDEIEKIKNLVCFDVLQDGAIGGLEDRSVSKDVRDSKVFFIQPSDKSEWLYRKLTDLINHMNAQFYGFELTQMEALQFTKYGVGEFYDKHIDTISSFIGSPRKLSFSLQLTDPLEYDGGELHIHESVTPIVASKEKGMLNIFPSFMLHEVTPVTRGTRQSLVGWVNGPWFK